jgi:DNA-binding NarL/FixJ family response regulator
MEEQSRFLSNEEDAELWASVTRDNDADSVIMDLQLPEDKSFDLNRNDTHRKPESVIGGKVYALCEMIFEDLNNYYECMIPIGKIR